LRSAHQSLQNLHRLLRPLSLDTYGVHIDAGGGLRLQTLDVGLHRARQEEAVDQRSGRAAVPAVRPPTSQA
jgi:hypothetical protein